MLTTRVYPDYSGGGHQALALSKALDTIGVDVRVFALDLDKGVWGNSSRREVIEEIPVYKIPGKINSKIGLILRYGRFIYEVWRKRHEFDILHAHGLLEGYVGQLISWIVRKPLIVKLGGIAEVVRFWIGTNNKRDWEVINFADSRSRRLDKLILRGLARNFDQIVCTTNKLQKICTDLHFQSKKLSIIPNGVDIRKFHHHANKKGIRNILGWLDRGIIIGTILSLRPIKGLDILLSACENLANRQEILLVVVGPSLDEVHPIYSEYASSIFHQAENLPPNIKTIFTGQVNEVHPYLSAMDIFILPSRSEGFPNAGLEALSSGLPCIFSNISWTHGIIEHNTNALLFNSEDAGSLQTAIEELINNNSLQTKLGKAARGIAEESFAFEHIVKNYKSLYGELLIANPNVVL